MSNTQSEHAYGSCWLRRDASRCPARPTCDCRWDPPQAEAQTARRGPPRVRRRHSREQVAALHPRRLRSERNPHFRPERLEAQARTRARRQRDAEQWAAFCADLPTTGWGEP